MERIHKDKLLALTGIMAVLIICIIICKTIFLNIKQVIEDDYKEQLKIWNKGICPQCQTEWHFKQKTESFCNRSYIYECENGHIIELGKLPE